MLALALSVGIFTSCEDVPAPYENPNNSSSQDTTGTVTPTGDGTQANPYNVIAALDTIKALKADTDTIEMYVKGKIVSITEIDSTNYGNATYYISDDGTKTNQLYIYRSKDLGNKKFTSASIKVGDEVVVYGKFVNYKGNTPETAPNKSYLYSVNGNTSAGTPITPPADAKGDGTEASPYNITAAIAKASATGVYVKGYVVGYIYGKSSSGAVFSSDTCTVNTNLLIADSPTEKDVKRCMPVQLSAGAIRNGINLADHKAYLSKEILLCGDVASYFSLPGLKSLKYVSIDGQEYGTKPSTESTIFTETFASSLGGFTEVNEKDLPSAVKSVWIYDSKYKCAKASGYVSSARYETDSWLISPALDLTGKTQVALSFEHAGKFFGTPKDEVLVKVSTDYNSGKPSTATWTTLTPSVYPDNTSYTFYTANIDLSAYAGKNNVRIAFEYKSTMTVAGTWEVKNVVVK